MNVINRKLTLTYFIAFVASIYACAASADSAASQAFLLADQNQYEAAYLAAANSREPYVQELMAWRTMRNDQDMWPAQDMMDFFKAHTNWPLMDEMQRHIEKKLLGGALGAAGVGQWFAKFPPISGAGKMAQLLHKTKSRTLSKDEIATLKSYWIDADLPLAAEVAIAGQYGSYFNQQDHFLRAGRLVWDKQYSAAGRMLPFLNDGQQAYIKARIALQSKSKDAPSLFNRVPASYQDTSGMSYSRLVYRDARNDISGAIQMLQKAGTTPEYGDKWWPYRNKYTREAIDAGRYDQAISLLRGHGLTDGSGFAEAKWLLGWLLLEKKNDAASAYLEFDALYRGVSYAISQARGAYWAGRAASKMGQNSIATDWFKVAASYPTTFYGQMAMSKLGQKSLDLPSPPSASHSGDIKRIAEIIKLSFKYDQQATGNLFIKHFLLEEKKASHIHQLMQAIHRDQGSRLSVRASKRALQNNILIKDIAFPVIAKHNEYIEPALMHAIIRQESEFDPIAQSGAGATGLMQLMPATARQVAKKHDMPYDSTSLNEPEYNMALGSRYLYQMLARYNASYVLAIAAYNAGPGNVDKWIARYGRPGKDPESVINWIERIPFSETRNYVQRVLENLQIYRERLDSQRSKTLLIEEDLMR